MPRQINRRLFVGLALVGAAKHALGRDAPFEERPDIPFDESMRRVGQAFRELRRAMRSLDTAEQRDAAATLAHRVAMSLGCGISTAPTVSIPMRSHDKYADRPELFTRDLRVSLLGATITALSLAESLWKDDNESAREQFKKLRALQVQGHDAFQEEN